MKMKFFSALTGAMLVALASTADAGQPLALSDHQLDGVTAGAAALATAAGQAIGELDAITIGQAKTYTNVANPFNVSLAQAMVEAAAASVRTISSSRASVSSAATLP
jgi:hypothetical protein